MQIELKKLKIHRRLSEETTAFAAELFVNGHHAAHVSNDGKGGAHRIHWVVSPALKLASVRLQVESYAKALPAYTFTSLEGANLSLPMDLDLFITNLVATEEQRIEDEKMNRKARKMLTRRSPITRAFIVRFTDGPHHYDAITFDDEQADPDVVGKKYVQHMPPGVTLISCRDAETRVQRLQRWATMPQLLSPPQAVEVDTAIEKGEISGPALLNTLEALGAIHPW